MAPYKIEPDVEKRICHHLKRGDIAAAESLLNAHGGIDYAFRHGYDSLAVILEAAPENAHLNNETILGLYCEYLSKKVREDIYHPLF